MQCIAPHASNRLQSTAGPTPAKTFTYDGAGNVTGDGQTTFTYDARGRMVSASNASGTHSYAYNALGERVKKSGPLVPTGANHFVYDEQGRLTGEYDVSGNAIQEIVYLNNRPVASLRGSSTFFVFSDHLDTPRWVTQNSYTTGTGANDSGFKPVWSWESDPFGTTPANENPHGLGTFAFNLRFAGQYFDKETNLHYNYFRDYDPAVGRYIQSDPLGVRGLVTVRGDVQGFLDFAASWSSTRPMPGVTATPFVTGIPEVAVERPSIASAMRMTLSLNLYSYAENNPLLYFDSEGLQSEDPINLIFEARANAALVPILNKGASTALSVANRTGDPAAFTAAQYFERRAFQCSPSFVQTGAMLSNTGNVPGVWGAARQIGRSIWSR